jgi:O-antigen/teichoic acid export membrane protein
MKDEPKVVVEPASESSSMTARAAWILCAKTVAFALTFVLPLLLVRRLSRTEFGLYKQVFLFVNTAFTLLPLGVGMSAFYFLPRERERQRQSQIVFNILLFHALVSGAACLLLVFRPTLLAALFNSETMRAFAPLVGLVVLTWVSSSSLEMIAIARQEVRLATVFIVAAQLTKAVFLLSAAVLFGTVESLLYAAIIQGTLQTLILLSYLRSRFGWGWRGFEWSFLRMQLAYALPFGFASMLFRAQLELDNYFVAYTYGPSVYAIYAIGCFELPLLGLLSDSIASVTIPRVSHLQKQGARREIAELVARMMRKLSAVLLPLCAFLWVAGREFITVLFTAQYIDSWPIFAVNLVLIPLAVITSAYDPVLRAYAEHRYFLLKLRGCLLILFGVGLWFGVRFFDLLGAVAVMVSINVIDRLVTAAKVKRILNVTRRDLVLLKDVGKVALASTAAALAAALVRSLVIGAQPLFVLALAGCVFAFVYLLGVVLLGVPTAEERGALHHHLARFQQRFTFWKRAADHLA